MGVVLAALFLEPDGPQLKGDRCYDSAESEFNARAEQILNTFYSDLQKRHARERECFEREGLVSMPPTKWNQQEVYLDYEKREKARAASHQYLERHRDWLSGPNKYNEAALTDLVAVQHYIDLDLEDLLLPERERRNSDVFGGLDGNICEPFLRDAPRCRIKIDGRTFSFSARLARQGVGVSSNPAEAKRLRQVFLDDLTAAVLRSLGRGGPPPVLLVRAVTSTMSQSGLASVERACYSSQLVVNGGEQTVQYKLQACADGAWDVTLSVRKVRFEECIICSHFFEDPSIVECRPKSFVSKSCSIRFFTADNGHSIRADVFKLHKEICLESVFGSLVTGHSLGHEERVGGDHPPDREARGLPCASQPQAECGQEDIDVAEDDAHHG